MPALLRNCRDAKQRQRFLHGLIHAPAERHSDPGPGEEKGKGFHGKNGVRGDQIIELQIRLPEGGDAALSAFVEGWSADYDPRAGLSG